MKISEILGETEEEFIRKMKVAKERFEEVFTVKETKEIFEKLEELLESRHGCVWVAHVLYRLVGKAWSMASEDALVSESMMRVVMLQQAIRYKQTQFHELWNESLDEFSKKCEKEARGLLKVITTSEYMTDIADYLYRAKKHRVLAVLKIIDVFGYYYVTETVKPIDLQAMLQWYYMIRKEVEKNVVGERSSIGRLRA